MTQKILDAVIFDLDGVITESTPLHSEAWKTMFDDFLRAWSERNDTPFREFTHEEDYLAYVDGKPRYKGVESFLQSRGIQLPYGDPSDPPQKETICGLGNRKNAIYNQLLEEKGVEIYAPTVELIHQMRDEGIPMGVASSSKNAKKVLEITGLIDLFQTCVDGIVSAELGLKGKPSPDIFTTACDNLGAAYERSVIVEDAISGVQAGYRGNFGLVIGVAREENKLELKLNGADIVVEDMGEIDIQRIKNWFSGEVDRKQWSIEYTGYEPEREGARETLCTIGNGYFGTRGALEEIPANGDTNYPGTYIAGLYNRLESTIAGRTITNEDFVNCPNWLPITFKIEGGDWFDPTQVEILDFSRELDFKTGTLTRKLIIRDEQGHQTQIISSRFASMDDPHLAALRYQITPLNYAKTLTVRSTLEGNVINYGVKRYRELSARHLTPLKQWGESNTSALLVETNQSKIKIAEAAKLSVRAGESAKPISFSLNTKPGSVSTTFEMVARSDHPLTVDKIISIYSSNVTSEDVFKAAKLRVKAAPSYEEIQAKSNAAWKEIWDRIDIKIRGDRLVQKLIRLHLYHSLVTASPHHIHLDAGIPARGLHGEAYRGHIFWDELFIMPFYDLYFPETARSVLMYRYRRLPAARKYAQEEGYRGAIFPWQSGLEGREETQRIHLNPIDGKWGPDFSHLQRHVSLAIAYNIWQYLWITDDIDFVESYGAEIFLEICRYWGDKAAFNEETGRFDIENVMGPDEFHEKYPHAEEGGL
ncbi:MAG: beta-phosphoglucomutase family hydrolase, partial [Chloroflexota bacterium]